MHRRACRCAGHEPERHHVTTREVSVHNLNPHQTKTGNNDDDHVSLATMTNRDWSSLVARLPKPVESEKNVTLE